jgi:hypothetical protein
MIASEKEPSFPRKRTAKAGDGMDAGGRAMQEQLPDAEANGAKREARAADAASQSIFGSALEESGSRWIPAFAGMTS